MKKFSIKRVILVLFPTILALLFAVWIYGVLLADRYFTHSFNDKPHGYFIDHNMFIVNLNDKSHSNEPNLALAIKKRDVAHVKILLDQGADVSIKDPWGFTMLTLACHVSWSRDSEHIINNIEEESNRIRYNMLELLLHSGANPNVLDDIAGMAPIHHIAELSNMDNNTIKLLIDYGADINILAKEPNAPLPCMINSNMPENLRILFEQQQAYANIVNNEGKTPLDIAIERNYQDNIEILRKYGAKTSEELKN